MLRITRNKSGMAAILTVVIVGAALLIMAKSAVLLSVDDVTASAALNTGEDALVTAEGCAEETLRRIEIDPGYTADDFVFSLGNGECVIDVDVYGEERVIDILGSVDDYYKRLQVTATINGGGVIIDGWEETN